MNNVGLAPLVAENDSRTCWKTVIGPKREENLYTSQYFLTLKTNISPLSRVTVSKSPSQMLGSWWSGSLGGRGGGGGGRGGGGGTPFLTGGVVGSMSGGAVGMTGGDVVLGLGSGGGTLLSVGRGASGCGWLGEVAPSIGGSADAGGTLSGRSSWIGGAVRGGPKKEKMRNCLLFPPTT